MILTHKSNGLDYVQVVYKWQGSKRYFSFGYKCKTNLAAAEKYMNKIRQIRLECMAAGMALPIDPPRPEKAPSVNKLIAEYQNSIRTSNELPMDLFFQIAERTRELNLTAAESLRYLERCEANYKHLITEKRLKAAQAKAKKAATIAAKKANTASHQISCY